MAQLIVTSIDKRHPSVPELFFLLKKQTSIQQVNIVLRYLLLPW